MSTYYFTVTYSSGQLTQNIGISVKANDGNSAFITASGKAFAFFANTENTITNLRFLSVSPDPSPEPEPDPSPEPEPEPTEDNGVE